MMMARSLMWVGRYRPKILQKHTALIANGLMRISNKTMKAEELKQIADQMHDEKAAARAEAEKQQYDKIMNDATDICIAAAKHGEYSVVVYYCEDGDLSFKNTPNLVIQRVLETLSKKGLKPKLEYNEEINTSPRFSKLTKESVSIVQTKKQ